MSDTEQEEVNRNKLKNLADKIHQISNSAEKQKTNQLQSIDNLLRTFEHNALNSFNSAQHSSQLFQVKSSQQTLHQLIHNEHLTIQSKHSSDLGNIKELDDIVHSWVSEQKAVDEQQSKAVVEGHNSQLNKICQETKDRMIEAQGKYQETYAGVAREVSKMRGEAESEKITRQQAAGSIAQTIGEQLQRFKEAINRQTKTRINSQQKINNVILDIKSKLKGDIDKEKTKRQNMGRSMLSLIEAACQKLERKLLK